ncbi:hypothetical protein MBLNU230_g5888t1 [Neophaeotheca triangularis]
MYRRTDPRFRRTLNDISHTLESANESAQSNLYIFGQHYVAPCFHSIETCFASCLEAGCPTLNVRARDRLRRRGRARSRGRAELSFDFYDDWEDLDEQDGLLGWGGGEDGGLGSLTAGNGYGTVEAQQPGRQPGMNYPKARRKSVEEAGAGGGLMPSTGQGFWGRLFGGKAVRYAPSAADLQEHPGSRRLGRERTEGEALLEGDEREGRRGHRRERSDTVGSGQTSDSYSSRGDLFPSDDENDAIPLDDEFAMVLERRTTNSGQASAPESETSSGKRTKKGKRPSAGSRTSTRRTFSSRSVRSRREARRGSTPAAETPSNELPEPAMHELPEDEDVAPVSMADLQQQEKRVEEEEEGAVRIKREAAERVAARQGLTKGASSSHVEEVEDDASEDGRDATTPNVTAQALGEEPSQLPTPLATDDEEEQLQRQHREQDAAPAGNATVSGGGNQEGPGSP